MSNVTRCSASGVVAAVLAMALAGSPSPAANIIIDYTYDTTSYFGAGNPDGATAGNQARASLEAAASFFSTLLQDELARIETPPEYISPAGGVATWSWSIEDQHPTTGAALTLNDPTIATDEYRIYAGAMSLGGMTAGEGGVGGFNRSVSISGNFVSQDEIDQLIATTDAFLAAVDSRGKSTGFGNWGGTITFDADGSTPWHYDHTTSPSTGTVDFFSVALHELGHALGLGGSSEWMALVATVGQNRFFTGASATSVHGSSVPLELDGAHWQEGLTSSIWQTATLQETAMDPSITDGTRKLFTTLDVAALEDIGWVIPEPASAALLAIGAITLLRRRA